ncbi:atrial natriuretic peptide receptor 1 [Entelurus aequoreus]|uniref:atrial natriuretic peptide receptor 1 n=1 Tax=Entelurus aequoreus TaxID=161455 RepID=UPI002B1E24BF|nr:atrial natriuretic peptide receptor 1 [Entelurus aequoreus]XP_061885775.1 atrial natriuretic peptide receptor 1 [Entelurus aequoreus]XP_061885776.1 atrial natriuretic peptide receptor 1 [Entelurus aequoreus]XP_061885777.1 atrial natriuretic peptide receptor 1 [Entelurus aequoreus]XP_061885778.1 atrial natriuretic peptide receptor 1 [Entelurus aequoreus]
MFGAAGGPRMVSRGEAALPLLILALLALRAAGEPHNVTLAVILPETNTHYPWAWPRVGPALERAVRTVNADPALLPGLRLDYVFKNSEDTDGICSEAMAALMAANLKLAYDPWAFIGPGCSYTSSPVGLFTTHWDVPMVTAGAPAVAFYGGVYPSITNTGPTHKKLGRFALRICEHFGWREHVMLMFSDKKVDDRLCYFAVEGLFTELGSINITLVHSTFEENKPPVNYAQILADIQNESRVMFVCCSPDVFRKLMVHFRRADLPHEQYVFFYIDVFGESLRSTRRQPWARGDEDDAVAKEAFQSVKILTYQEPQNSEYQDFVHNLKVDAKTMFNYTIEDSLMNIIAGGFYDGLMLYTHALNETMTVPTMRPPGTVVTRRMWNRTFQGVTGTLQLDENGDRETDFALWDMIDTNNSAFQMVLVYNSLEEQLTAIPGTSLHWLGGVCPPDIPVCGFKNDNPVCLTKTITIHQMVSIVVVFILTMSLTVAIFIYRKMMLEKELVAQLWRISWDDINMSNLDKVLRSGSRVTLSLRGSNYGSLMTTDGHVQVFAKTGYYKGNLVAIKYTNRKRIELNRKVLFELKHMRDVQNEHLTRFIGACIDPPNTCIMTEYCPRGSLQDILENDSITLDWMFKYSLINDIIKGMVFLHNSVIVSHGKLKSSNCVVDKRFVLKITDYGLSSLQAESQSEKDAHSYYAQRLWMAPELLQMDSPPPKGTQKGDVYSFGIILQEVALRRGAFYLEGNPLSPKEIVDRVVLGEWPCLRPTVDPHSHSPELGQLMQRCWAEEPTERPEFNHIQIILRKHNKESRTNILDNLLSRMEQYANNLEELVEERTQAYHEEKRKAEALLYQILPHSVAEQLKRGETVQAESFDSVTIYFSDIVGFTSISAESTPMEVVTLLNDLYTCFDAIIDNFDVYKVETIGDAYMVVSGLPVRNGKLHGREVARMALALLDAVTSFKIRHRPDEQLKLRIGVHSGPVCAGVVGLKMPRYCLFGDTVNTSSRMESSGEALKIHVSAATCAVLQEFGCFQLELRGDLQVKGKGKMTTYWLLGESSSQ